MGLELPPRSSMGKIREPWASGFGYGGLRKRYHMNCLAAQEREMTQRPDPPVGPTRDPRDFKALEVVVKALQDLPPKTQARILQSAVLFFGLADELQES